MAVTNASTRHTTSVNAFTGLTYIDTVIGTAAGNGLFSAIIEGNYINDTLTGSLITAGYTVHKNLDNMGTYPRYTIIW
jgi:predicted methyltransferase